MRAEISDLLNATEVAEVLGVAYRESVSVYRRRHADFPEPVMNKGKCVLWLRQDVEAWRAKHPARER